MKKLILIVEDEHPIVKALEIKLRKGGFDVIKAGNGQEGLDASLSKHPDLILLDILMPVMDGLEMLRKLRTDLWGSTVPVFILTNYSDDEKTEEAAIEGAYLFMIKADWHIADIVKKVKETLGVPK